MDLKNIVSDFAPLLGGLIGGPAGATVGKLLASTFGGDSDKPDELAKIIQTDPNAAVKLREIESNNKVELQRLVVEAESNILVHDTARVESINSTMRQESISGDAWQRRWRPFWGYMSGVAFFLQIFTMSVLIVTNPGAAPAIITAFASLNTFWLVPLAVLGVSAYQRGKEKRTALGENFTPILSMFNKKGS